MTDMSGSLYILRDSKCVSKMTNNSISTINVGFGGSVIAVVFDKEFLFFFLRYDSLCISRIYRLMQTTPTQTGSNTRSVGSELA